MIIGIDNGISGGLAAISAHHGLIIAKTPMPIQKTDGKNEIDVVALKRWLVILTNGVPNSATYVIEKPVGSKSAAAGVSMAGSFHALRGTLEALGGSVVRVSARTWQKALSVDSDAKKAKAIELARSTWPDEDWRATPRSTTPHTGMVDAALIAYFFRLQCSHEHL